MQDEAGMLSQERHTEKRASILSKSSITHCVSGSADVKTYNGQPCSKMLVVALTVTGDEGKSRFLQADVSKVVDNSNPKKAKNVQLQYPLRIKVQKSPVLVHFDMHKVATFSHRPYERLRKKNKCRADWFAKDRQLGCGRKYTEKGEKIFDSQGVCCGCDRSSSRFDRATTFKTKGYHNCMGHKRAKIAHCMELSPLIDHAYELLPPRLVFTISVTIEEQQYTLDDKPFWKTVSTLELGPHRRIASSSTFMVKAEYIADFHPDSFTKVSSLMSKYVIIPDLEDIKRKMRKSSDVKSYLKKSNEMNFLTKSYEWLAVDQTMVALPGGGNTCNKMGVTYSDFRWQPEFCSNKQYSCLYMQAHNLYWNDKVKKDSGKRPQYMLSSYGKLYSITNSKFSLPTGHITFKANRHQKSLLVITLAADDLKIITHLSPARIVEAYIDPFEALTETGELTVIIQNIGTITASYQVHVVQCSAGIDFVPSDIITLNPQQTSNISFEMHSVYSIGQINNCDVELHNQDGEMQDNMTVYFETEDTCFCYGHCGCACGNETNTCPPPPTYHKNDTFVDFGKKFRWFKKMTNFMKGNIGKFILVYWFFWMLMCLGLLKVVHMLITGQINYPALTDPAKMALDKGLEFQKKLFDKWCPACYSCVCGTLQRSCLCCCACVGQAVTGQRDHKPTTIQMADYEKGWRRPRACDGMCEGARTARRLHRKQMRINKRKGMKNETAWYDKKYECTCKVKDTMPCCEVCKGLCFFFYLPLLPLWWVVEFLWEFGRRKWQRHKRKKRYRAMKESQVKKDKECYLSVDQYTRGKVEKQILGISQRIKSRKRRQKNKVNAGFDAEDQREVNCSENESSDTTDEEQARDIDELLNPGHPVFFNYASILPAKAPSSLKSPGKNFSIKGKLTEKDGAYIFELYQYTHQVKYVCSDKVKTLKPPKILDDLQFTRKLPNEQIALKLITLSPLFTILNDGPKKKN